VFTSGEIDVLRHLVSTNQLGEYLILPKSNSQMMAQLSRFMVRSGVCTQAGDQGVEEIVQEMQRVFA
jgi:hypothetical protein